jgi:hypothetical protein
MASVMTLWDTWDRSTIMPRRFISFTTICAVQSSECMGVKLGLILLTKVRGLQVFEDRVPWRRFARRGEGTWLEVRGNDGAKYLHLWSFFGPMSPHVRTDFVVPPPGCGRSVTDFWGWGPHRAQLSCPDDVSVVMCERGVPGKALNLSSTGYPDRGRCGDHPLQGKIPTAEPGIEPGTSWLVVRSSDHQAARLVTLVKFVRRDGIRRPLIAGVVLKHSVDL